MKVQSPLLAPENVAGTGSGGGSSSAGASSTPSTTGASSASSGSSGITSGTATEAMIKAAMASSSDASDPAEAAGTPPKAAGTQDPSSASGTTDPKPPVEAKTPVDPATGKAEAPEARIVAAVRNARMETERKYGITKDTNPADVKVGMGILNDLRADPVKVWRELGQELASRGVKLEGIAEEKEEAYPAADLISEDGKLKTYSEETHQKILALQEKRIIAKLMGELRPALDFVETEKGARSEADRKSHAQTLTGRALTQARGMAHFKDNEPAIAERMASIKESMEPEDFQAMGGPVAAMFMAYNQVLAEKVFPGIEAAAEAKAKESMRKKANASDGTVHPTEQGTGGKTPQLNSVDELARHMEKMAASAAA